MNTKVKEHEGEPERIVPVDTSQLPVTASAGGGALAVIDYGEDAGRGMEGLSRDEVKIGMLRILQSNSPQVKPPTAGGLAGAAMGMIFNTATKDMWDGEKGVLVVPVERDHNVVEYVPRDNGGGFVGIREPDDELFWLLRALHGQFGKCPVLSPLAYREALREKAKAGKLPKGVTLNEVPMPAGRKIKMIDAVAMYDELNPPGGTELVDTFYLFLLVGTPDGMLQRDVATFSSTNIDMYKSFMTMYDGIKYPSPTKKDTAGHPLMVPPPLWAHRCSLKTTFKKNKKGEFYGWALGLEKPGDKLGSRMRPDDPLYKEGRAYWDLLKSGGAKIDRESDNAAGGAAADGAGDDEIPF